MKLGDMRETPERREALIMEQSSVLDNPQVPDALMSGWTAGILDGEGCFSMFERKMRNGRNYVVTIQVTNTDPRIIATYASILKQWGIGVHVKSHKTNSLPTLRAETYGLKRCKALIERIYPFLVSKKDEAYWMHRYVEYRLSLPYNRTPYGNLEAECMAQCQYVKKQRHLRDFAPSPLYNRGEDKVHEDQKSLQNQ